MANEFGELVSENGTSEPKRQVEDELNELIDLMTMAEETRLSEQLKELEQLEAEKRQRLNAALAAASGGKDKSPLVPTTASGLFSFMKKSTSITAASASAASSSGATAAGAETTSSKQDLFELMSGQSGVSGMFRSTITDLFTNANDEFEREWQSVFGQHQQQQQQQTSHKPEQAHDTDTVNNVSPSHTEFSLFTSGGDLAHKDLTAISSSSTSQIDTASNQTASKSTSSDKQKPANKV